MPAPDAQWIADALARYEAPLLRFATRILRDVERARDVVQETFLQLCQQDRTTLEDHLAPWLFRVCRNRALDLRRKETRVENLESLAGEADTGPGPHQLAEHREDTGHVMQVLETLPENQQEAVFLRFQGGLSYQEISDITGHSVTNVGFLLHSAVKKIRAQLAASRPVPVATARTAQGGSR